MFSEDLNDTFDVTITFFEDIEKASMPPIGSIIAWHKSFSGAGSIPSGWVECNGGTVSNVNSPVDGQTIPTMNGTTDSDKLFVRGNTASGVTGGASSHGHTWSSEKGRNASNVYRQVEFPAAATSIPPYFEICWIMRIL